MLGGPSLRCRNALRLSQAWHTSWRIYTSQNRKGPLASVDATQWASKSFQYRRGALHIWRQPIAAAAIFSMAAWPSDLRSGLPLNNCSRLVLDANIAKAPHNCYVRVAHSIPGSDRHGRI